jgi:hypothetical protein
VLSAGWSHPAAWWPGRGLGRGRPVADAPGGIAGDDPDPRVVQGGEEVDGAVKAATHGEPDLQVGAVLLHERVVEVPQVGHSVEYLNDDD